MNKTGKQEFLRYRDFGEELLNKIIRELKNYSLCLVWLKNKGRKEEGGLLGSGTLIKIKNKYCILTAGHVVNCINFKKCEFIGFSIGEDSPRLGVEKKYVETMDIYCKNNNEFGPDIGLIIINDDEKIGWLKAKKMFWNMDLEKEKTLLNKNDDEGAWCICGSPDELTEIKNKYVGYDETLGFHNNAWLAGLERKYEKKEYDYYEFSAIYGEGNDSPNSFGGVSGGGAWQIKVGRAKGGNLVIIDYRLIGVAFYQSSIVNNKRIIRCHGIKNIYVELPKII